MADILKLSGGKLLDRQRRREKPYISFPTKDTEKVSVGHIQKNGSIFPLNLDFHPLTFEVQPQFFLPHTSESE